MSEFTDLENWCERTEGVRFVTVKGLGWEIGRKGSGLWIRVPVGFPFDVSIPRWMWFALSPTDPRFLKAACLHDYALYALGWDRVSSAAAFSEALRASGVGRTLRLAMVVSVIAWRWK